MPGGTVEPNRTPENLPVRSWSSVSWVLVVVVVAAAAFVILAPSEKAAAVSAELTTKSRRFIRVDPPRRMDVNIELSPFEYEGATRGRHAGNAMTPAPRQPSVVPTLGRSDVPRRSPSPQHGARPANAVPRSRALW